MRSYTVLLRPRDLRTILPSWRLAAALVCVAAACQPSGGGGGSTGGGSGGGTSSAGGYGGASSAGGYGGASSAGGGGSSSGGEGGSSSSAGGGGSTSSAGGSGGFCVPGSQIDCYTGPAGTEGIGLCKAGKRTCDATGTEYGPCIGEVTPVPEDCATPEDQDCDGIAECAAPAFPTRKLGGAADDVGWGVAADAAGNLYATGTFQGTVDFGAGPLVSAGEGDVFVLKLDPAGNTVWSKRFGVAFHEAGNHIAVDPAGNIILFGVYGRSMFEATAIDFGGGQLPGWDDPGALFLVKLDPDGNHLWSHAILSGQTLFSLGLALDPAGAPALLYGWANGFGSALYLSKRDTAGNQLWWTQPPISNLTTDAALAVDGAGNVLVTTSYKETPDGATCSPCDNDVVLRKLDPGGAVLWTHTYDGPVYGDGGMVYAIATDDTDAIFVTGRHHSGLDFGGGPLPSNQPYVVKLTPGGDHLWSTTAAGGKRIALAPGGGVAVTGNDHGGIFFGGGTPPMSSHIALLDSAGAPLWSKSFTTGAANGLTFDPSGRLVLVGAFGGMTDLGDGPLVSNGGLDAFVAALAP